MRAVLFFVNLSGLVAAFNLLTLTFNVVSNEVVSFPWLKLLTTGCILLIVTIINKLQPKDVEEDDDGDEEDEDDDGDDDGDGESTYPERQSEETFPAPTGNN
jgi:hypothetical protein